MATTMTTTEAKRAVRDLAAQDAAGEFAAECAAKSAEKCIADWRASAAEAGDLECVEAIDLLGSDVAAQVYERARK